MWVTNLDLELCAVCDVDGNADFSAAAQMKFWPFPAIYPHLRVRELGNRLHRAASLLNPY